MNRVALAILVGALVIAGAIWLTSDKECVPKPQTSFDTGWDKEDC